MGGGSRWDSPSLRGVVSPSDGLLSWPLTSLAGFALSLAILLLLTLLAPPLALLRLLRLLRHRTGCSRTCDVFWPCDPLARAVIFLRKQAQPDTVASIIASRLAETVSCCSSSFPIGSTEEVQDWNHRERRLKTSEELDSYLNDTLSRESEDASTNCTVHLVSNFIYPESEEVLSKTCGLAILTVNSNRLPICILRIISCLSQGHISFEMEPRIRRILHGTFNRCSLPLSIFEGIYSLLQLCFLAPVSLAALALRHPNPVWKALETSSSHSSSTRPRRPTTSESDRREESGIDLMGEEKKGEARLSSFCWIHLEGVDRLERAERLLRASSFEIMTSLVSGALRANFREEGIAHPPDVGGCIPVAAKGMPPIGADHACAAHLLPISLPTGVEGAIPRLWAVQRRVAETTQGVLPTALSALRSLGSVLLEPSCNSRLHSLFLRDSSVHISLFRATGDVLLSSNRMESLLLQPGLPVNAAASFCFVVCGGQVVVSARLNQALFPHPKKILSLFQREASSLVEHLSPRLLSLTQATFLPDRVPFFSLSFPVDEEESPAGPSTPLLSSVFTRRPLVAPRGPEVAASSQPSLAVSPETRRVSLGGLQELLARVERELEAMHANPAGDRAEYIRKLAELESDMEAFHQGVAADLRLNHPGADSLLASNVAAELLAPYKEPPGAAVGGSLAILCLPSWPLPPQSAHERVPRLLAARTECRILSPTLIERHKKQGSDRREWKWEEKWSCECPPLC